MGGSVLWRSALLLSKRPQKSSRCSTSLLIPRRWKLRPMRRPDLVVENEWVTGSPGVFRIQDKSLGPTRRYLVNRRPITNFILRLLENVPIVGRVARAALQVDSLRKLKPGDLYEVMIDMNGFKSKDIRIAVKGHVVSVQGKYDHVSQDDKMAHAIDREFTFPEMADTAFLQAILQSDGTMRLSAPVVALAEEVEKLIPVQQLPPPAPPPENVPPNRNLYSMECEVCGPFSKPRKADPGEIHLDPDCQNKSTRRLGLRGSLTKLFEKLSPRKRPQPISTSAEEITPISTTKKTQANIPKPAVDDPRLATLKEPGASARSVPVQEESSSAFSLPEGRSGDKTSRMFEKPLNFRETFQKAENSPRRQKDKILEKAGRDADDIFDRKTENLRLSSKSSSSQQIEETAADRRNRQDMRRQKQNAVDEADNAFTTPAMTSIRDNEVWEGEKEQFNLDSFLDNQMYIDPNKPKATATTNKERREDGATRRMGRTIAKQKDWMPRTSSSRDKN